MSGKRSIASLHGGARRRATSEQGRTAEQDAEPYATRHKCSTHLIEYYAPSGKRARCPQCMMERDYDEMKAQLIARENELKIATNELNRLRVQVDVLGAIRAAIDALDDNDYLWLKLQMYQYKIDKSVMLKATHGKVAGGKRLKRGDKLPPNGFMTVPKHGDPEAHQATSLGGLAMAEYLDEAITCFGSAQAMGIMLRAWWKALPGAQS